MLKLEAVASAAPTFFSGNFARFMVGTSATTVPETRILFESSGAILASGAVQFGAGGAPLSSVAYSRFGSLTTTHSNYISSASDVFISGDLEVKGSISANIASASQFKGSAFSSVGDCNDSGEALGWDVGTFSCLSISGGTAAGDTGEIQFNNADAFAASSKFFWDNPRSRLGIGSAFSTTVLPATTLEVQGTASASYFISSGSVQFGSNAATAQYSRFGGTTTGYSNWIRSANDLLISGDLELIGTASLRGPASLSGTFTSINAGSNSFAGSLNVTKGIHSANNVTATGLFLGYSAGSNSFLGSLNISKGLTANSYQGGGLAACGGDSQTLNYADGQFSCGDDDDSATVAAGDTGEIQFNNADAFSSENNFFWDSTNNRLGINGAFSTTVLPATTLEVQRTASASYFISSGSVQLGSTAATAQYSRFGSTVTGHSNYMRSASGLLISGDLELIGTASLRGPASLSGTFTSINAGSNSFAGSLNVTKGIHSANNVTATGLFLGYSAGSNSFLGSLNISKGLTANSYQGGGLAACGGDSQTLNYADGQFSCGDDDDSATVAAGDTGEIQFNNADAFSSENNFFWDSTNNRLGINGAFSTTVLPATTLEVQRTASASYFISSGSVQLGSTAATAQYSRFGSTVTGHSNYMRSASGLLISGDLELIGTASLRGPASLSGTFTSIN